MKCLGATVRKSYVSFRYRGEPVKIHFRYDTESNRWWATSPNVPLLITEGASIEDIERDLSDIMELIVDVERRLGPAVPPGNWEKNKR